ncbi:MAG: heme-binding protein [Rhodanobacter sp.]|nr:MAG: heme-binding protein [Rhodanobacter sp.]
MQQAVSSCSVPQRCIDWPAAQALVAAAAQAAQDMQVRVNVAVVDPSGVLAAFLRMPGAPLHSVEIAIDKAYTAASFGLPTSRWPQALAEHSAAVREGIVLRPRFIAFGGGLPVLEDGQRIGGIGVSGGSEAQDEAIANAGLHALPMNLPRTRTKKNAP